MPSVSIDTFFACALTVSVALVATAFFAGTMQTRIDSLEDTNENQYLGAIAEHMVTGCGTPTDWGLSGGLVPTGFGLAKDGSSTPYELDVDKISRLNSQSEYALSYPDVSKAARLNNIALGISIAPLIPIAVELYSNATAGDATVYTFRVSINETSSLGSMGLHCYAVAGSFVTTVSSDVQSNGVGYVNVEIPNASSGPSLFIVFARVSFDDRMTSFAVCSFSHLSAEPSPNNSFLGLRPLNYVLKVNPKQSETSVQDGYFFSYSHQSNLTSTSESTYSIPTVLDKSPIVLVLHGVCGSTDFVEWASYPLLPVEFGADFVESEENVFVYMVTVKETLYKLTLRFGGVTS